MRLPVVYTSVFCARLCRCETARAQRLQKKHGADKATIYLFYTCSMRFLLLTITHPDVGFSRLLE